MLGSLLCVHVIYPGGGRETFVTWFCQDALEILRAAPKPSASQELRALQILSQAHQGKGDKSGTDAVHESLKRFQASDNRSAEVPNSA